VSLEILIHLLVDVTSFLDMFVGVLIVLRDCTDAELGAFSIACVDTAVVSRTSRGQKTRRRWGRNCMLDLEARGIA